MDEKELNLEVTQKYMEFNASFARFFRENRRGPFRFENRNRGQAKILGILRKHPQISQKELVAQLDMRPQSASEMIQKLEKKGLISRSKSEEDKRIMLLELTTRGKIVANQSDDFEPIILNVLTLEEKQQFNHILDKLIAEIKEQLQSDSQRRR